MNRSSVALGLAVCLAGCNAPVCGPGTKQVQVMGGGLQCQPVDGLPSSIGCDVDAGAQIVGGVCVSRIACGPNTSYDPTTGLCTGTGGTGGGSIPACNTPKTGTGCVHGQLHNFVDNAAYTGPDVKVALYDPTAFLNNMPPITTAMSTNGGYVFQDYAVPPLHLIAVAVGDFADESSIVVSGAGAQNVQPGSTFRVDVYVIPRAVTDGWKTQTGNDYLATGAFVAKFYGEKLTMPSNLAATEMMKVAGVTLMHGSPAVPSTMAQYFDTSLMTINPSLTVTGTEGAAIVPSPAMGTDNFSGKGGTVNGATPNWESELGGSAPNVIFVSRFHPM